jgi:hypothetical protein
MLKVIDAIRSGSISLAVIMSAFLGATYPEKSAAYSTESRLTSLYIMRNTGDAEVVHTEARIFITSDDAP